MEMILTDIQILAILLCLGLSLVAYKTRIAPLALVPSMGFFILGFQIYDASQDILILVLFFLTAITQFVVCFRGNES